MLRLALLSATALVVAAAPARAEPISTAIGLTALISSIGVSTGVAGALGGGLISIGVSLGLSTLASVLSPKPKAGEPNTGVETSMQIGGDVARQIAVGRVRAVGQPVHRNSWGASNTFYDEIRVLSDWHSEGLVAVWVNGKREPLSLIASGPAFKNYTFASYYNQLYVTFWDGTQTVADSAYVTSSNPPGRWTNESTLTGCTYVAIRLVYAKDAPLYDNGLPDLAFEFDGAKLYDRRQDDTAGGSGSQRWDDPVTWTFSANPIVATENYLRGL